MQAKFGKKQRKFQVRLEEKKFMTNFRKKSAGKFEKKREKINKKKNCGKNAGEKIQKKIRRINKKERKKKQKTLRVIFVKSNRA